MDFSHYPSFFKGQNKHPCGTPTLLVNIKTIYNSFLKGCRTKLDFTFLNK